MKNSICVIASVLCVAACNKGPEVNLKNATGNQVAQAVHQSGVMTSGSMIEPGLWQSKATLQEMNMPGLPPQFAEQMKKRMAESQVHIAKHCLTPEQVKRPKEDFFASQDKSCRYARFTMGAGKIDIQMVCSREGHTQTTDMAGTYTATTYSMDMSSNGSGGGAEGNMSMKMHVDANRVGECAGKEG